MKKKLFTVTVLHTSTIEFKSILRTKMKEHMPSEYFKTFDNDAGIKNIGCLIFGQKDVWKGLIYIEPAGSKEKISISLDAYRNNYGHMFSMIDLIFKTLLALRDDSVIYNFAEDFHPENYYELPVDTVDEVTVIINDLTKPDAPKEKLIEKLETVVKKLEDIDDLYPRFDIVISMSKESIEFVKDENGKHINK